MEEVRHLGGRDASQSLGGKDNKEQVGLDSSLGPNNQPIDHMNGGQYLVVRLSDERRPVHVHQQIPFTYLGHLHVHTEQDRGGGK